MVSQNDRRRALVWQRLTCVWRRAWVLVLRRGRERVVVLRLAPRICLRLRPAPQPARPPKHSTPPPPHRRTSIPSVPVSHENHGSDYRPRSALGISLRWPPDTHPPTWLVLRIMLRNPPEKAAFDASQSHPPRRLARSPCVQHDEALWRVRGQQGTR
ncbi:hypothetical protein BC567DRAFT_24374 [Phyllosticta citribraziliensis]